MPIEKVNLGLQVVTTVATIWLGYVGYELAKAQNQIAEVQTYGIEPTINVHQALSRVNLHETRAKIQITNNHTYPITTGLLIIKTNVPSDLKECKSVAVIEIDQPSSIHFCLWNEVIKAGELKILEFLILSHPAQDTSPQFTPLVVKVVEFSYYDPVRNGRFSQRSLDFDLNEFLEFREEIERFSATMDRKAEQ